MKLKIVKNNFIFIFSLFVISCLPSLTYGAITEKQSLDVAEFAKNFIEQGNNRRDEEGFPLLTYALSGNWNTCIEIRNSGYNEKLYYIKRNSYYYRNGKYMELGNKWCMDCGTFVTYMLKKTLGLELYNGKEPWHVQDIYNDAYRGTKSKYFEFVYKSVSVGRIDYSKLQPGDVIARITGEGNHGMLYVGDGMIAHANRDMIKYRSPAISGFQVSKLNQYYLSGTVVRVMRIKDGIIPVDLEVNSLLTWPDTGEIVDLLGKTSVEELERMNIEQKEINKNEANIESSGDVGGEIVHKEEIKKNKGQESGDISGENIVEEASVNKSEEGIVEATSGDISGEMIEKEEIAIEKVKENEVISEEIVVKEEKEELSNEERYQKAMALQETKIQMIRIKPLMLHVQKNNKELYSIRIALINS